MRRKKKTPATPQPVDFFQEKQDHECALLGALGFSTNYICEKTGLTPSQVSYRLAKAGLTGKSVASRKAFRNGTSPFVKTVLGVARDFADRDLVAYLKANL